MDMTQAKAEIVGNIKDNTGTLDAAADALILRVAQFFGECVQADTFCGLSIDESRDAHGQIKSLTLVACDMVGEEPVRREGRFSLAKPDHKPVLAS